MNWISTWAESEPVAPRPAPPVPVTEGVTPKEKLPVVWPAEYEVLVVKLFSELQISVPLPTQALNESPVAVPLSEFEAAGVGVKGSPL